MKLLTLLTLICLSLTLCSSAQTEIILEEPPMIIEEPPVVETTGTDSSAAFIYVEQMPQYAGGEMAMMKFIGSNLNYPTIARDNDIEGKVFILFIVERDGTTSNHTVKRSVYKELDEEALRVAKLLRFEKPGYQNGKPVRVEFTLPVKFSLD
ncbi:MAG: energy transducer TonB [Bacteroidia bacterium]